MKPLYYRNAKWNLWATIKPWFSPSYWAYLIIRRKARKSGKPYAVITLPVSKAMVMAKEITEADFERVVAATVPAPFQRPADPAPEVLASAAATALSKHFEAINRKMDVEVMKAHVQERIDSKPTTPEQVAQRIAAKAAAQRQRQK